MRTKRGGALGYGEEVGRTLSPAGGPSQALNDVGLNVG